MQLLKGIAWDHPRGFDPMVATAAEFKKNNPNFNIVWEKRPLQAFADRPIENMAYEYDLMVIDHPHVGEASRKGLIYELNNFLEYKDDLNSFKNSTVGLSHQSYNFNENQYALSIDAAAPVSAFRKDLIENIPKTFEETIKLAEKSLVMWPIKPIDAISCFNSIAANLGKPINNVAEQFIDLSTGKLILKMMKQLADLVPKDCLKMNPINVLDHMSSNDEFIFCPMLYGYSNYSRKNFRKSIIYFGNIISFDENNKNCSGSQIGGTGLAVSKSTKNLAIALKYAFWIASEDCQKGLFFNSGGQPAHISAWKDKEVNNNCNQFFENTLETLKKSWVRPRYDGYMYFQDIGGTLVNKFLKGETSIDFTINEMKKEFEKSFYVNK